MENFQRALIRLNNAITKAKDLNIDLTTPQDESTSFLNFKSRRKVHYQKTIQNSIKELKKFTPELSSLIIHDTTNEPRIKRIIDLVNNLQPTDLEELKKSTHLIKEISLTLNFPKQKIKTTFQLTLPIEINTEINADLKEIDKCFEATCYRSATVLCGRILETALHRKYYEITNQDILEKNPGIGLGKLVAKLNEKNVKFDPGTTQQIHLINQVRISSVHKKQETFYPTKEQTEAIILFTVDILKKLFK